MESSPGRGISTAAPRAGPAASSPDGAQGLPHEMLAGIVDTAPVGIAVIDSSGRCAYVNSHGRRLLGARTREEAARAVGAAGRRADRLGLRWPGLRFSEVPPAAAGGQRIITFQRAPAGPHPQRLLPGLSWAVASMLETGSLAGTLDAIAAEVKDGLHLAAANIVLHGEAGELLGGAGFGGTPEERIARLQCCDALGAEFKHREATRARRLIVVPHRYESVMRDPRWAPAHAVLRTVQWDGFAAAPLEARGRVVGTLSAFYPAGLAPVAPAEVQRLAAVADQAAAAVDNADLLAKTRQRAAAQERNRLGRELHDAIVQDVFSLAVHSRTIQVSAEAGGPVDVERIRAGAAELIELSRSALTALSALIFELRPPALQEHTLAEAVRAYAASLAGRSGVPIEVVDEWPEQELPEAVSDHIYRVVQEALHNAVRHARASRIVVRFSEGSRFGAELVAEITDDGTGFDPGLVGPGHLGLITMRERSGELGGSLEVRSRPGEGTCVALRVPRPPLPLPGSGQRG